MNWWENWYPSGYQGEESVDNAYMKKTCEQDFKKLCVVNPYYNKYNKDYVCKGPYWNNSRYTKKLKLKFVSTEFRNRLEQNEKSLKEFNEQVEKHRNDKTLKKSNKSENTNPPVITFEILLRMLTGGTRKRTRRRN